MTTNGDSMTQVADGLNVIIAGAGIGGLTAALALRQEGHTVTVFERSRQVRETGAAIHVAPNCNGLLRRLGLFVEDVGANVMQGFDEYKPSGEKAQETNISGEMWQHPWHLVHRVNLHKALQALATDPKGVGKPVKVQTASRVVNVDCQNATFIFDGGEWISGDIAIGADGVNSETRQSISGEDTKPFGSGKSAFRFMIPRKTIQDDPRTAKFVQGDGRLVMIIADDRRIVIYPCNDNTLMNFLVIHPSEESRADGNEWDQEGNLDRMLEICKDFSQDILLLISKADAGSLKVWELRDMQCLSSWTNGNCALLGDAAHPFLPHQGQGGAQAIEDAVAIAAVLRRGTPKKEIAERLKLYQKCRLERAHKIQHYTRLAGRDLKEIEASGEPPLAIMEYTAYNFGHDEWDHSSQMLRKWQHAREPNLYWRMPISFGPSPGPRQDLQGRAQKGDKSTFRTSSIRFKSSRTYLQTFFPTESFTFASPATVVEASISNTRLDKMNWLGGAGYSHCGLYIHGVKYTKKDGSALFGTFLAVLFENLTDPIITGREELGMPKLGCAIVEKSEARNEVIELSWKGYTFTTLELPGLDPVAQASPANGETPTAPAKVSNSAKEDGILTYRFIPGVGPQEEVKPDAAYALFGPHARMSERAVIEKSWTSQGAKLSFNKGTVADLPTLYHITTGLAGIPIYGIVEAKVVQGTGVQDVRQTRRIE